MKIDTKKEAFKLVHDPTHLLYLLFTKYGDIEEDYYNLIINQLLYNKFSHLNSIFKENCFKNNNNEFLKRIYNKKECIQRLPRLYDYYKNYYIYFCRPFFLNFFSANILHHYYNNKAEIFYKNNYSSSSGDKNEKENNKCSNSTSSSMDNDTEIKTIFTKRNKYIIDNDIDSEKCSITLSLENYSKDNNNKGLISKRSKNGSFEKVIKYFIHEYKVIDKKKEYKNLLKNGNNKNFNEEKNNDLFINIEKNNSDKKNESNYSNYYNKTKDKSYNFLTDDDNKHFIDIIQKIRNSKFTAKLSRNSELDELKKNNNLIKKENHANDILTNQLWKNHQNIIKDIINESENKNNKKENINEKNKNISRNNNNNKNIFKFSSKLNDKKSTNLMNLEIKKIKI